MAEAPHPRRYQSLPHRPLGWREDEVEIVVAEGRCCRPHQSRRHFEPYRVSELVSVLALVP